MLIHKRVLTSTHLASTNPQLTTLEACLPRFVPLSNPGPGKETRAEHDSGCFIHPGLD
jgi:hypothetical protein